MLKNLTDFFIKYPKGTTPFRMLAHMIFFIITITWVGIVVVFVTNFSTFYGIYQNYGVTNRPIYLRDEITASVEVNRLVAEQRAKLHVDRLYVSKFHDGKIDLLGNHFIYFSRISESTRGGVSNELTNTQNLPLAIFPDMLEPISKGSCYYVPHVGSTTENAAFLAEMGVSSWMVCPIQSAKGNIIGVVGVDGVLSDIDESRAPQIEAQLQVLADVLGSWLVTE